MECNNRLALFASPMDPAPTVGHVRAFEAVAHDAALNCEGIILAVAEAYLPRTPPIKVYNSLSNRVELAKALKYVTRVVTYRGEEELLQIMTDLMPKYRILHPSDDEEFMGKELGIEGIRIPELEAINWREDMLHQIRQDLTKQAKAELAAGQ